MTRLLASEFRRFRSRRLVKVLVALEMLAIVATGVIVFLTQEYALVGLPDVLLGTSLILVSVGWMLGASAIGADWHAGHLTTILTWEPRRGRVLFAKIAAALTGVFVLSLLIQALLGVALAAPRPARARRPARTRRGSRSPPGSRSGSPSCRRSSRGSGSGSRPPAGTPPSRSGWGSATS